MSKNRTPSPKPQAPSCISKIKILIFGLLFGILIFGFLIFPFAQEEFKYDAKGKRDPFIPLVTSDGRLLELEQKETVAEVSLEGIMHDNAGISYVIVNGEVLKVGERIGDYQVLKIEKNRATFLKNGEPVELKLKGEEE